MQSTSTSTTTTAVLTLSAPRYVPVSVQLGTLRLTGSAQNNTVILEELVSWLQEYGRQAVLSETGGGDTASCDE